MPDFGRLFAATAHVKDLHTGAFAKDIAALGASIGVCAAILGCASTLASVRLRPEVRVTLHVGEVAALEVPSEQRYSIGSAGDSLLLVRKRQRRDMTVFVYRAVRVGNETLVATPGGLPSGHCVSCVTVHYFVTVVH